ncbi:hypothetical protein ABK040_000971 [Willaertia magna]
MAEDSFLDDSHKIKTVNSGETDKVYFVQMETKGFRPTMEDAMDWKEINFFNENKTNINIFGLFDGHGGDSCSKFICKHLLDYCKNIIELKLKEKEMNYYENNEPLNVNINFNELDNLFMFVDTLFWMQHSPLTLTNNEVNADTSNYLINYETELSETFNNTETVITDAFLLSKKEIINKLNETIQNMVDEQMLFHKNNLNDEISGTTSNVLFCFYQDDELKVTIDGEENNSDNDNDIILMCSNVGDSRCILYDPNWNEGKFLLNNLENQSEVTDGIIELSQDHRPKSEDKFHIVHEKFIEKERKRIQQAGGYISPLGRVNGVLSVTHAFGDFELKLNEDLLYHEQQVIALPESTIYGLKKAKTNEELSFAVIACDGLFDVMTSKEVIDFIRKELKKCEEVNVKSLEKVIKDLIEKAIHEYNSYDNVSITLVMFK